ncbi:pyocin knob domain-containing protein [Rahnella inusitata]|uniref:pyocin knob domain-containing protein n=1 Tax=Rahnella inusitata TaxID=58169 RepID=UPI0039BDBE2C
MAWYKTGTVAVAATKVTGTGTNFLDAKFGVGPGQAFLLPASGTVKIYEIASVEDATHLTLTTSAGTVAAGAAYAVMSFYTDSVPAFAARLAAQLGYYQSQMNGWQQIMTGTGTVAITAPDGTVVNLSSFTKLTTDTAAAFSNQAGFFTGDANLITAQGIYHPTSAALNTPMAQTAILEHYVRQGGGSFVQVYHSVGTSSGTVNRHFIRTGSVTSGVTTWTTWVPLTMIATESGAADLRTLTTAGEYAVSGAYTNGPAGVTGGALISVKANGNSSSVVQTFVQITGNNEYTCTWNNSVWSAWQKQYSSTDVIPLANGGTGATTAASARTNLGLTLQSTPTDSAAGRVMTVGAFGIGGTATPRVTLDGIKPGGLYLASAALGGIGNNVSFLSIPYDDNTGYELIVPTILAASPRMFLRTLSTTTQYNGQICEMYTTGNTTKGSGGVLSAASPVARIVLSKDKCTRPDIDEDTFEWSGDGVANHEARGIIIERVDVGVYTLSGSLGFAKDSWHLKAPADPAGNGELGIVEGEEAEDGTLTIKLFKKRYKLNEETGDIDLIQGLPIDVPANSWIDVRMEMPAVVIEETIIAEPEPTT